MKTSTQERLARTALRETATVTLDGKTITIRAIAYKKDDPRRNCLRCCLLSTELCGYGCIPSVREDHTAVVWKKTQQHRIQTAPSPDSTGATIIINGTRTDRYHTISDAIDAFAKLLHDPWLSDATIKVLSDDGHIWATTHQ